MSTVVQVDSDKVIVTQFERRKNRSALPRFIFHSASRQNQKLNPDLNRIPFSLFIQVVSEFCSWRIPIFLKCYVIFAKCAFAWEQIRAIVWENNLNPSLKHFILLFIPPCLMQASLLSLLGSQGTDLCAVGQPLHCIGLFPSTCACGVSAPPCSPASHTLRRFSTLSHTLYPPALTFGREGRLLFSKTHLIRV